MQFKILLPSAILVTTAAASVTIEDICQYTLPTKQPAIICLRADQPLNDFPKEITATASIGVTPVKLCCKKGSSCLLNNATNPEVMCYDSTTTYASSYRNAYKCNMTGDTCNAPYYGASTKGVLTVVSVKDGVGSTGSSSGSSGASSTSVTGGTTTGAAKSEGVVRDVYAVGVMAGWLSIAMGFALTL
ncbi:hypothetical protein BGZ60DRAFT_538687 [Tricladium varicosporioides]|nr:hypothetical protein BGZ60DRAFT_538687 [Hymenoscyphus varicosporioides]